jgi:hypothetical protein
MDYSPGVMSELAILIARGIARKQVKKENPAGKS